MFLDDLHHYLLNGAKPTQFNRTTKRKIHKRDGKECVICGSQKDLTVAHRIHRNGNDDPRLNDSYNLILMCDACHKRFDGEAESQFHILYWDPYDAKNGLEVAIETMDGGLARIDKKKLAFYQ